MNFFGGGSSEKLPPPRPMMTKRASQRDSDLFAEMFAMDLSNPDHILEADFSMSADSSSTDTKSFRIQTDFMDSLLLLKSPLETYRKAPVTSQHGEELLLRWKKCGQKLGRTFKGQSLSAKNARYINRFITEAETAIGRRVTHQSTWPNGGHDLPLDLKLQGMFGQIDMLSAPDTLFSLRGPTYLRDGKKVPAPPPLFHVRGMQIVEQPHGAPFQVNVAHQPWCGFPQHYDQQNEWLLLNYLVPGTTCVQVVILCTAKRATLEVIRSIDAHAEDPDNYPILHQEQGWAKCLHQFYTAENAYRDRTFKIFPNMLEASWMIQAAVGRKPALVGNQRLKLQYFRGRGYLEIAIDMSSSVIAQNILGLVRGVSKNLVVDVGLGIEPTKEEEMPEALLALCRYAHLDLDKGGTPLTPEMMVTGPTINPYGDGTSYGSVYCGPLSAISPASPLRSQSTGSKNDNGNNNNNNKNDNGNSNSNSSSTSAKNSTGSSNASRVGATTSRGTSSGNSGSSSSSSSNHTKKPNSQHGILRSKSENLSASAPGTASSLSSPDSSSSSSSSSNARNGIVTATGEAASALNAEEEEDDDDDDDGDDDSQDGGLGGVASVSSPSIDTNRYYWRKLV
mmetsp:Transcript_28035/g.47134  ORF Transcript_28035/g.47134 Transcript_28035/m.47134 type:complete len:620 (+) Transcript_28035:60-1919(+)|eukprot:CAMPEP_0174982730 /NCGR_PEP_ID=MMETSP0004_2-20121128/16697_1 /TAXON_ID=420556 /ORGANISM="Ochromonas sp., Strain CCMP1393" /LENGTH=619 /DNA_ID=CAMNT_0016234797 /DNA_START=43 /DNA_END=1902 /DNA_ORIENTATION=-